jgi:hypothetical protein
MKLRGVKFVTDEEYLFQNGWFKEPARDGKHWMNERAGAGRYDFQAAVEDSEIAGPRTGGPHCDENKARLND